MDDDRKATEARVSLLVLDDSQDYIESFALLCAEADLGAPIAAHTVSEALAIVRRQRGDFIVCFVDLGLRGESGLEFVRELALARIDLPIAILSDTDETDQVFLAAQVGAASFFSKDSVTSGADLLQALSRTIRDFHGAMLMRLEDQRQATKATAGLFGEFVHDVRGIFEPIQRAAGEIEAATDDAFILEEAQSIVERAQFGETYLDILKEFSETGHIACHRDTVDIAAVVEEIWKRDAREGDVLEIEQGRGLTFELDRRGVERIFTSLIRNVTIHHPGPATVRLQIRAQHVGQFVYCHCLFGDDGPGIAREAWDQVFLPGWRAKKRRDGAGLGLAIARRWAEVHVLDGAPAAMYCAEGPEQHGAWFEINLPVEAA